MKSPDQKVESANSLIFALLPSPVFSNRMEKFFLFQKANFEKERSERANNKAKHKGQSKKVAEKPSRKEEQTSSEKHELHCVA